MPTVLVVDDTASIRFLIRTNLELAGFEVTEAVDGQDALESLATDPLPDIVTMDVMMPRRDGLSAVAAIRADERTRHLGIVMVTTQGNASHVQRGLKAGVDAYVIKPFDPDLLVATIEDVYARR